ncbi:MAG: UDP-3-O-(3-hydroxymyristoyl)glucosamine N-acyltransferase [Halofilum sp. (in: g-proteobacteria)]|nr:UDP-3-O-(3-hydroxymyristoyl)glucosamine N-acyltransferase [Halofilum sp. (in: g-proteobacteria)]
MSWTVQGLAERLGVPFRGDGDHGLERVASLASADPQSLTFLSRSGFLSQLAATRAGAAIVTEEHAESAPCSVLLSDNPYATYARAAQLLHPPREWPAGIHPSAAVEEGAVLGRDVHVGAHAVIEARARVGDGAVVAAGARVGHGAHVGPGTRLGPNVVLAEGCRIGARGRVQPGAIIGSDGFGFAEDGDEWVAIPQIGCVIIGDDVEVGANTTIDRGSLEDTVLGDGVILDNQIQIAHNVRVGDHTAMAGCVGVAGSAHIGRRCTIGGAAVVLGHLEIVDDVHITAMSLVTKSITLPGTYSSGTPLEANADWRRNAARFRQLDRLARRVADLEREPTDNKDQS